MVLALILQCCGEDWRRRMSMIQILSILSIIPIINMVAPFVFIFYLFRHKPLSKGEELIKSALVALGFVMPLVIVWLVLMGTIFVEDTLIKQIAGQIWVYLCWMALTQGLIFRMRR